MVNTGKPSRGCYMCRARRIKCDEGRPGCNRCLKSKRECPGYRDAFELKLRDESKSTKKKLNRRFSLQVQNLNSVGNHGELYGGDINGRLVSHSRNSSWSTITSHSSATSQMSSTSRSSAVVPFHHQHNVIAPHMTTPIQQQAACYFLSNFVLVPEAGTMRGYLDFVLPLMKHGNPQTSLLYALSAVTLAALGTRPNSKSLQSTADLWYLKALKEINLALKDPKTASSEATLASVMLMASFEQLTPSRIEIKGWTSHIDGAVAMIRSSPLQKWSTGVGRDIFIAVRAHMTIQHIANSQPVDSGVDWMGVQAYDDVVQSFAAANLKMAALRADNDKTTTLRLHTAENVEKVLKLLRRAEALDREYIDWVKALPSSWAIRTVAWIDGEVPDLSNSVVYPGRVDAYGELWMAYKYNVVRACRLFIWTVILRCVAWLGDERDYRLTPEYITASRICQQLIEDIVCSVPYFFGWNRDKDESMADRSNFACGTNDPTTVKPLAGLFGMWPLFAAATSDFASPPQREFLRGRLKYIAEMMGINQALIMFQARLAHPSLYIARERMNIQPSLCKSLDSKVKMVSVVPSVPSPPSSQNGATWTTPPIPTDPAWSTRATSPPEACQAATTAQDQAGNASVFTPPQDQNWTTTPPPAQIVQATTPPEEQLWVSTSNLPQELLKPSSPPHTQDHLWTPPSSAVSQPWRASSADLPTEAQIDSPNQVYSLPISLPQEQTWQQAPVTTVMPYIGELVPAHDPGQIWTTGFEDPAPNWLPRTLTDQVDLFIHEQEHESGSQVFETDQSTGFGVAGYNAA